MHIRVLQIHINIYLYETCTYTHTIESSTHTHTASEKIRKLVGRLLSEIIITINLNSGNHYFLRPHLCVPSPPYHLLNATTSIIMCTAVVCAESQHPKSHFCFVICCYCDVCILFMFVLLCADALSLRTHVPMAIAPPPPPIFSPFT